MQDNYKNIMLIAGEASGDVLGAGLANALLSLNPQLHLSGTGGKLMADAGVDIIISSDELAVVGVWEAIKKLVTIRRALKKLKALFTTNPPDLLILIDYPGFNLHLAKFAKQANIKILFYVSPQIWAWRYHRIKKIKQYIDHMAVFFAFEEKMYQRENVPVSFVGHPLADEIAAPTNNREQTLTTPCIALLPGSRQQEITSLLPTMVAATQRIAAQCPQATFVLPLAPSISAAQVQAMLTPNIRLVEQNNREILAGCHAAIAASGTVTLELALHEMPMVIIYKLSTISYWLAKRLIKLPFFGLCNIVAEQQVAVELLQDQVNSQNIANEIIKLVEDSEYRQHRLTKLKQVRINLGSKDSSLKTAQLALRMIDTL